MVVRELIRGGSSEGGGAAAAGEEVKLPEDLLELVLSWSVEDIHNEELYKEQVGRIPQKFGSVGQHMLSYMFPLMEEVREDFCSHLKTIYDAPYAEILSIEEAEQYGSMFYYIKVHMWKDEASNSGRRSYKPMPGDVLIFSNIRPEDVSDLNGSGNIYSLASIVKLEDVESEKKFVVRTSKSIEVDNGKTNMLAIFLLNITTNYRIWKALGAGCPERGVMETISGRWKVLVSDVFRKSFSKLKSPQDKKDLIHMLLRLADGWRAKRFSELTDSHELTRIYNFKDLYLAWSVDVIKDIDYIQVLKVWDLLPMAEMENLTKRLGNIFSLYDDIYIEHCKRKQVAGKVEIPISWKRNHEIVRYKELCKVESGKEFCSQEVIIEGCLENSKVNESLLLMKFYSLSFGIVKHLLTAADGSEIDIPFELTDEEKDVILFPYSSFILGRSGTGKTTILAMKLVQKEQQYYISCHGFSGMKNDCAKLVSPIDVLEENIEKNTTNFMKQIFVTVSPKLCSAVRNHVQRLVRFASGEDHTGGSSSFDMHDINEDITFRDIPDNFDGLQQRHYPLIITFRKFLVLLDGTLMDSYFNKFNVVSKFPTIDSGVQDSGVLQEFIRSKEVNFERFVGSYWPHFAIHLTKQLDPATVFTEIMSHIKGGVEGVSTLDAKLSRENYIILSDKRISTLSRQSREKIYDLFLDYEKKKQSNGEFDLSDIVMDLHRRLRIFGSIDHEIDFVYIDEVQDLTMRQIALFKHISKNVTHGFVFAGDTAQTIARGVDFRFEDIRSLFYKEFLSECGSLFPRPSKEKLAHMSDNKFQLNQNFRTHVGILNLAQSILDVLHDFFPWSVDKLAPETSWVYGDAPIILESGNEDNAIMTIFGDGGTADSTTYGFGAEQTILVRDEYVKQQILKDIGKQALVLTIVECKGLEFQDVLLYNFFGDSPLKCLWRLIYGYMRDHCVSSSSITSSFPTFDVAKHNILCSELKQLYVAITRTRQRLWICETTGEYCQPMFDYWKSLGLVQVRRLDSTLAEGMCRASSTEEWSLRGIKFFNEENFEMAAMCFERAGDDYREKWSRAASLRANAGRMISTKFDLAQMALKRAAEIYESIDKPDAAASCFITLKDYKTAGMIYMEKCGTSRQRDAGDCFAMAECWSLAADAYAKAKCLSKCLSCCITGKLFDFGLAIAKQHEEDGDYDRQKQEEISAIRLSYLDSCALHFLKLGNKKKMMVFVRAFNSMDLVRPFLKSRELFEELLELEVEFGNYPEAIDICRLKGDILLEAEMLEKAGDVGNAAKLIIFHVLVESFWASNRNGWPPKDFPLKEKLLKKAQSLAKNVSCSFYDSVCLEAELLSGRVTSLLGMSKYLNDCFEVQNLQIQIFCLRMIIDFHLQTEPVGFSLESEVNLDMENHAKELVSQNHFSVETMVHFWGLWKEKLSNVLSYLHSLEESDENGDLMCEEFCSAYFGVRKEETGKSFVVLNSKASWIKDSDGSVQQRHKGLAYMDASQFSSCAQHFINMELVSVGMRLVSHLKALQNVTSRKKLPLLSKGKVILRLYEVASFLRNLQLLGKKLCEGKAEKFISLSKKCFFNMVFPYEWITGMTMDMISLRENSIACKISEEIMSDNLVWRGSGLTHGQIGRVVMVILVTGNFPDELFNGMNMYSSQMQPWKEFIASLKTFLDSGSSKIHVVCNFLKALECTFSTDWRCELDYISPDCFLYLLDALLLIASSCHGKGGYFLTTKSSLFEILSCHSWKGFLDSCLVVPDSECNVSITRTLISISTMVRMLLNNQHDLQVWMRNSACPNLHYSSFLLRLVNILSLSYLNIGGDMNEVTRLLLETDIKSQVPKVFSKFCEEGFAQNWTRNQFLSAFSEALWAIGNPLVAVCTPYGNFESSSLKSISINSDKLTNRNDALAILFPKGPEYVQLKDHLHKSVGESIHMPISEEGDARAIPIKSTFPVGQIQHEENEKGVSDSDLQAHYVGFWETLELSQSGKCEGLCGVGPDLVDSNELELKVEKVVHVLSNTMDVMKERILAADRDLLGAFLGKLQLLSKALNTQRDAGESNISMSAGDLCVELQDLKSKLQPLMDSLLLPSKNTNAPTECITEGKVASHLNSGVAAKGSSNRGSRGKDNKKSKKKKGRRK